MRKLPGQRILSSLCRFSALKEVGHNCPFLNLGLRIMTPFMVMKGKETAGIVKGHILPQPGDEGQYGK